MDTEIVVRLRATATRTDPYSQTQVPDWSQPAQELPLRTLAPAEPLTSTEPLTSRRDPVLNGWRLFLSEDADVTAIDRVRVRGVVYDVDGLPGAWCGGGLVVQTTRTEG